jgi:hypothetical protein
MKDVTASSKKEKPDLAVVPNDQTYMGSNLPVTQSDFDTLSEQRKMLKTFVAKQLTVDVDYGKITGTPKPSLFKPGAEKLNKVFGLGARFTLTDKEVDRHGNFASYTYKCEIYHLKSGNVVAECEGMCSSQEKKYKERAIYKWENRVKTKVGAEATPIADIQNTLMKMAQKRAMVGATILATGASDFFSQDLEDLEENGVSVGLDVSEGALTPKQVREKKIKDLFANLQKVGVSEKMVRAKYGAGDSVPLTDLSDAQCKELSTIGQDIHDKKILVRDAFRPVGAS